MQGDDTLEVLSLKYKAHDSFIIVLTGKFQMQVLPQCGHAVHEDSPDKVGCFHCSPPSRVPVMCWNSLQ